MKRREARGTWAWMPKREGTGINSTEGVEVEVEVSLKDLERYKKELETLAKCLQSESQSTIRKHIHLRAMKIISLIKGDKNGDIS